MLAVVLSLKQSFQFSVCETTLRGACSCYLRRKLYTQRTDGVALLKSGGGTKYSGEGAVRKKEFGPFVGQNYIYDLHTHKNKTKTKSTVLLCDLQTYLNVLT